MIPIADYHMHTPLCGHAIGEPEEYIRNGIKSGLKEMGFSDHAPLVSHRDPKITMDFDQLPIYLKMIENVKKQFANDMIVKIALEADFIPGFEQKTQDIIKEYPYDYIIGSVHFIRTWGFDDPAQRESWSSKDVNQVYHDYYELLRQSARSGLFQIIGHCDLVKKFGHRATENMFDEVKKTAKVFKDSGVAIEINTAGLRKPVKEMYPSLDCLKIYCQSGVPLTFGSDAHAPNEVAKDFDKAIDLAKTAGFKEYLIFKQQKVERTIKL
ncbi:MAG: histidinol-phosphatase HisJ [Candidatus Omnitrophica bacterium]|nr:histidinol-phosphatase HisJ [Candidatus Omnitrophota bacterium]